MHNLIRDIDDEELEVIHEFDDSLCCPRSQRQQEVSDLVVGHGVHFLAVVESVPTEPFVPGDHRDVLHGLFELFDLVCIHKKLLDYLWFYLYISIRNANINNGRSQIWRRFVSTQPA